MSHNCQHNQFLCEHDHMAFCKHCNKPFCLACGKEWPEKVIEYIEKYPTYPAYPNPWSVFPYRPYVTWTSGNTTGTIPANLETPITNSAEEVYKMDTPTISDTVVHCAHGR